VDVIATDPVGRILIVGTTGSGKSTLAKALAKASRLPHVELDMLRYERDWQEVPADRFRTAVEDIVDTDAWIIDGNYASVRELTWSRAQLVVWMDYSLAVVLRRLLGRTVKRLLHGVDRRNPERIGRLLGPQSILLWALRSHAPLRREYEIATSAPWANRLRILRHRSIAQTNTWLDEVVAATRAAGPQTRPGLFLSSR
jgi:cytidylate kinase